MSNIVNMSENQQKGNILESAVRAIETTILRVSPSYNEKTFNIESKRILNVDGVRHEIDVFVRVDLGVGYEAIFVFECKNWVEKVGKNEIIIFAEKIRAAQAQKGFFVARSFTSDAEAQATKEPRMELLRVTDLPTADIAIPFDFHLINPELKDISLLLIANPESKHPAVPLDMEKAKFTLDGEQLDLRRYVMEWAEAEGDARTNRFPSARAEEGPHELTFEAHRDFSESVAIVNDDRIREMKLNGLILVRVVRPKIVSYFDVEKRGRALSVRMDIKSGEVAGEIITTFTWAPTAPGNL